MRLAPSVLAALLIFGSVSRAEAQEKVRVAVANVEGRKAARPAKLERGIRFGIGSVGVAGIPPKALSKAARDVGVKAASPEGARAVAADYLLVVELGYRKRRHIVVAELIRASDGEVVKKVTRRYRSGRAALKVGKAIGKAIGRAAKQLGRDQPAPPPPPPPVVVVPPPPPDEPPPPPPVTLTREDQGTAEVTLERPWKRKNAEDAYLHVGVGGGMQVASAYTVAVGDTVTGLAYSLSPLFLVSANLTAQIPQIGLFLGGRFDFAPVKYAIDVVPAVDPAEPSGRFLSAGGLLGYRVLDLEASDSFTFTLAPVIAFGYDSLSVEEQGLNTVVVSWNALDGQAGLRLGFELFDTVTVEVEGRGGLVFGYSEKPTTTGEGASGFNLAVGGRARYWITDLVGVSVDALYGYRRISMEGMGTRTGFMEDPPLMDATIFSADLKLGLGVLLAI